MLVSAAAALGALLLIGGIAALLILKPFSKDPGDVDPLPVHETSPSPDVTQPAFSEPPTAAPTAAPAETESAQPTLAPTETAAPSPDVPIRISDDLSSGLVWLDVNVGYGADGKPYVRTKGSISLDFVNNTDSVLYSIDLVTGDLNVDCVSMNGFAVNYTLSDGTITIPFFNELKQNSSCSVFIEFSSRTDIDGSISLPRLGYDSPYMLTAYIRSSVALAVDGAAASRMNPELSFEYKIDDESVRAVEIRFIG